MYGLDESANDLKPKNFNFVIIAQGSGVSSAISATGLPL